MAEPTGLPSELAGEIEAIAESAREHDGADPLDEATRLAVRHRDVAEMTVWTYQGGFALLIDETLSLVVRPDVRRQGVAGTLLAEVLDVAGEEPLAAWSHGNHPGASALAATNRFARVRDLWVMRRPGDLDVPPVAPLAGVTVRTYRDEDADALVAVNAAAFAGHPEQGRMTREELELRMSQPWFDPHGLFLAEDDSGELLGFHWTKVSPSGDDLVGEVYVVGIAPAAQGRGVGKLLTSAGLAHLAERSVSEVELYVEGDNEPAKAMYGKLGFAHAEVDTHVMYRRVTA